MMDYELTTAARARQQAMLPGLLGAVRRRRHWRTARRAGFAAVLLGAIGSWPWWGAGPAGVAPDVVPSSPRENVVATRSWTTVRDDPAIVARYRVPTTRKTEWFVSDDDLRGLLRTADRANGVVRSGDRLFVSRAAIDPWPESSARGSE